MSVINSTVFHPYRSSYHPHVSLSLGRSKARIVLTPKEHQKIISFLKNALSTSHEIKFGKKAYLGSSSNLPRHKVKEYFTNNKIHKTSRLEQANTIIISKNSIQELYTYLKNSKENDYFMPYDKVYTINDNNDKKYLLTICNSSYISPPSSNLSWYIAINPNNQPQVSSELDRFLSKYQSQTLYLDVNYSKNSTIIDTYKVIWDLLKYPNINIIFDEDILPIFNQNGLEFNQDYITTLDSMFESEDQENINLALEMLSNIDLEKYSLALAMFLNKHAGIFYKGSGLNIYQNRSFKSFIKYFDSKNINFRSHWKKFTVGLLQEYKDDPQSIEIIHNFIIQNINTYLKSSNDIKASNWIKIENCTIKLK